MPTKPIIHTNVDVLKAKLQKYEPIKIAKRIGIDATVVIAINKIEFDKSIPILKEKHLKRVELNAGSSEKKKSTPKQASRQSEESSSERPAEPREEASRKHRGKRQSEIKDKTQVESQREPVIETSKKPSSEPSIEPPSEDLGEPTTEDVQHEPRCGPSTGTLDQPSCEPSSNQAPDKEDEGEKDEEEKDAEEKKGKESGYDKAKINPEDDGVACQSEIDCLVLTGPEDDEFRQYDEDDDQETTLSRNLKKIRTDPPPPPPPPPRTNLQKTAPHRLPTQLQQQQKQQQQNQQLSAGLSQARTAPQVAPPQPDLQVADIDKLLEQKNLRLVYAELNRRKDTFKDDSAARTTLKRSIFSCIERDDTFMLLDFLGLVFNYNYSSDSKFWDELIGKLKRKDNPHARLLTFKCDVEPKLVLHNYRTVVKKIAQHFDAHNPIITLPWLTFRYLGEISSAAVNNSNGSIGPKEAFAQCPGPKLAGRISQENLDPSCERNITFYRDDSKLKFKVTPLKGERKYSAPDVKLLI